MDTAPAIAPPSPPRLFTVDDVARLLSIDPQTVRRWSAKGLIPRGRRIGKRVLRWTEQDLAPLLGNRGGP